MLDMYYHALQTYDFIPSWAMATPDDEPLPLATLEVIKDQQEHEAENQLNG